jgi:ATP phosphoribosyltransferase regulatory subunit
VDKNSIVFEIGEDVSHKTREKEYRFLVYGNSDKYRVAMGRKSITEWRELIKRSLKRGELVKSLGSLEEDTHVNEVSDKLSEILEKCGVTVPALNKTVTEENAAVLRQLVAVSGDPETVLPQIKTLLSGIVNTSSLEQLERIACALKGSEIYSMVRIDFSVVDDFHYYNGIVFKGFVYGLPESVLSGGQYDKLMQKMKRRSGAIGFAVYMDMLERLEDAPTEYDVDTLLLYDENSDLSAIQSHVKALTENGCSVMVQRQIPENIKYRHLLKLQNGEVETLEGTS